MRALLALVGVMCAGRVEAAIITTADGIGADASVTGFDPIDRSNENHAHRPNLNARWTPGTTGLGGSARFEKFWIRFQLPSDVGIITSASLDLFWNRSNPFARDFEVFGLLERSSYGANALTGESRLGEDWAEDQVTWNNAPGNIDSLTDNGFNPANTVFLYSFNSPSTPQSVSTPTGIARTNLVNFLNSDTNGLITLMVRRPTISGVVGTFASKENTDAGVHAPQLDIEYSTIPEPSSLLAWVLLSSCAVLYGFRRRSKTP